MKETEVSVPRWACRHLTAVIQVLQSKLVVLPGLAVCFRLGRVESNNDTLKAALEAAPRLKTHAIILSIVTMEAAQAAC